ncbi:tetratricopeptide repeat protein [Acidovorax sp.]|uniref:YfgM family protein n=1 Tax=Acidovorax sp. TaxID=1872122 RepID=UPI002ACD3ABB|nr:tetratricopeptide repeat protein [Acidovorax sp.]MDZ7866265.1 tetratricopeptide repeat protein [Acidovorax sp.]
MANHLDLEEQEQLDQLKHFWNQWGTLISCVLIVVCGSLAAWNGYQYWQGRQATKAAALFDAVEVANRAKDQTRVEQAFGDLKASYAGTPQAAQAGFLLARSLVEAAKPDEAREVLAWVAANAGDDGFKALAKLRLAAVLTEQKKYDEALAQLSGSLPAAFDGVAADHRGDILMLQDKRTEALAQYTKAYKAMSEDVEYRRLVEVKLNALGSNPAAETVAAAKTAEAAK